MAPETVAIEAGRLFLREIEARIAAGEDFAFETTLSGKGYVRLIERLRAEGWTVELYYLALPEVDMSKRRVAERVEHGGHNIPAADIERRFPRSLHNLFNAYRMIVDRCVCHLNVQGRAQPVFAQSGNELVVFDQPMFDQLKALAARDEKD